MSRVTTERQALATEKAEINVLLGKAEDLSVQVNGMINRISMLRRDLFTNLLTKRYELTDAIGDQVISDVLTEGQTLRQRLAAAIRGAYRFKFSALMSATSLALLAALAVHFIGRRLFGRLIDRDPGNQHPSYINRLSVAFWSTLLPSFAVLLCFGLAIWLFDTYGLFAGDILQLLAGFLGVIWLGVLINRLSRAVLSPDRPHWRLIRIEARPARILVWLMTVLAVIVGLDGLASLISDKLGSPLSVTIVKSLLGAILSSLVIITIAQVRPFIDENGASRPWPRWFRAILYVLGIGSILAAIFGYLSFAQFVSKQIVITGAMITTAYIGLLASRAISEEGGFAKTSIGSWMKSDNGVEDTKLDQLGVLFSVIINVLIVVIFLPFVLFQWGFQPGDIATWMNRAAGGFQIGTFSFSPFAIVTGVCVFIAGYFLTRWFQRWLDGTVMARGKVELGVRNSIRTVVGYAGMALAALIAISSAGLDLSNFALVAGGLSLGIGFGLQNIVSNFVSGLILLAERPLKVGDWVEAGAVSGTVKKISVRATEIETFQRQTVILPNSVLINGPVGNWTHRNKLGRIEVPVGVEYRSDAKKVYDVLLEIVRAHPMVLRNPEPMVLFTGFTDTAMTFEARGFLADINNGAVVRNDIRFSILDAFKDNAIALAYTLKPDLARSRTIGHWTMRRPRPSIWRNRPRNPPTANRREPLASNRDYAWANCGVNVAFSCRSDCFAYKFIRRGEIALPTEAVPMDRTNMVKPFVIAIALAATAGQAIGASAVNLDNEPRTIIVTEGGNKQEIALGAGETVEFCSGGCFVTMPNGDREALTGGETVEISGGVGKIK